MAKKKTKKLPPDVAERRALIMEIVENQLRDRTPPETRKTLHRLVIEGYSHDEAVELIACVVGAEIFDVLKEHLPFNESRFVARLRDLPTLPWDDEE